MARAADFWERAWRALVPPLMVVGLFLCVSWLGLWLEVPRWARGAGVALFALALLASGFGVRRLRLLSARDALKRVDKASGLAHRPASALADHLVAAGRDPATDAMWALHQRRAETAAASLKAGRPSPRIPDLDRFALRAGVLVALIACALVAGPQRYARIAAAFDFGTASAEGPGYRLDAWIDPPPYTGRPPVLLDLAAATARDREHPQKLAAPAGSVVVVRSSGGAPVEVETSGPLLAPAKPTVDKTAAAKSTADRPTADKATANPNDHETRLVLHGDSRLYLRHGGVLRGAFAITAIADKPPGIFLREVPKSNARGSLTLSYTLEDDYGVAKAEARFANPTVDGENFAGPPLVGAPKVELALPAMTNGIGDADTTADLSEHPWAGARVTMTLVARDEGGNEGRSEPVEILLPQKPFANPLSRALVEQRRILVLDPGRRRDVLTALDALMADPAVVGTPPSVYLGLRFAADNLMRARTDKQLVEVAEFLWGMALQLENGDLSDAEKALRQAEKDLRDAIDRKASDEEIQKLTQNLQAAMDKFLKELAEQQKNDKQENAQAQKGNAKSISPKDLQKLIERLREQARSGNREEAKKALDELQDILENLKTAKRGKPDPQQRATAEGLNQLDQAMRDQQDLRDETFKQGRQGQDDGQQQRQPQSGDQADQGDQDMQMPRGGQQGSRPGQNLQGRQNGQQPGGGQGDLQAQGQQGGQGHQGPPKGFGARQRELRDRLAEIQKRLKQAGEGQGDLDEAGKAMREAENALRQGEDGNNDAVDAQGRALDAMRKGAKKLADALQQQNDPNGQASAEDQQPGQEGQQEGQQNSSSDPLGRRRGRSIDSTARFNPMGIPAAQRAQRVLEELRRRLGDPSRSQEEIDYLERLLRSY